MQNYTVLSPWAEVDTSQIVGLSRRLDALNGKTIGMFGDFMNSATYMLQAVEAELLKRYPQAKFSYLQYFTETTRIEEDPAFLPQFEEWIAEVDACVSFFGSVPSSSLFLGYNSAYMERRGKPTVMAVQPRTYSAGLRGCKAIGVPDLRIIQYENPTDIFGHASRETVLEQMQPLAAQVAEEIIAALTTPLTEQEAHPAISQQEYARSTYTGSHIEISNLFYEHGWTNGAPINMPTAEAVEEMLTGTDLPRDHLVGKIPPKMGCATVEKIAVNAVMAGCLPTYMPILIAAVKGSLDKRIYLEGWTCSQSTWGPVISISGDISKDIHLNTGTNFLSPYYKANATIARAYAYIMMNIGGLRPGIEDLSEFGHENRLGLCIGDSTEDNPWGPIHEDFGIKRSTSAVTMFWPQEHRVFCGNTTADFLSQFCTVNPYGWDPGCMIILSPMLAKQFFDEGWTKQRILRYIVEYGRRPASEVDLNWLVGNSHPPKTVDLPVNMAHSTRIFWSAEHMFLLVGGGHAGKLATVFGGGGDHGGPSCTEIELPANWKALVDKYHNVTPKYINY